MADHFITGQHVVLHVQCGNGQCHKWWDQPGIPDAHGAGWNVCPHCNFAAPTNVDRGFAAALDREAA